MRAIVFDFFGTLTDPAAEFDRREIYRHTGYLLGADRDEFLAAMSASFGERSTSFERAVSALHGNDPDCTTPEHVIDDPPELLALVGAPVATNRQS